MFNRSVDVLVADLADIEVDEDLLSVAELGRALGIASPKMLRQYLAAHTWLRQRLAEYLEHPAADIEFGEGEGGKPTIVAPHTDLTFNLSYSGGMALLAVGFRVAVGVDIETLEGAKVNPEMVHRVLSRPEADTVFASSDMLKEFSKLWVRKEAMAKAVGGDQEMTTTNVLGLSPVSRGGFDITDVNLGEGFMAAVTVPEGCSIELTMLMGASV
jgi:4'-phosphopantetheinyl transferase EntD